MGAVEASLPRGAAFGAIEAPEVDPAAPVPRAAPAHPAGVPLEVLGERVRPVTLAGDRLVPVDGPLAELLPGAALRRGSVLAVEGPAGSGVTSLALGAVAAVTRVGEWAAACETPALSAPAVVAAGVAPERFVVVRDVPRDRRPDVLAALVEGTGLVIVGAGLRLGAGDARRLAARARDRGTVIVALGPWPHRAEVRLRAGPGSWTVEGGRLTERALHVEAEHRGRSVHRRVAGGRVA